MVIWLVFPAACAVIVNAVIRNRTPAARVNPFFITAPFAGVNISFEYIGVERFITKRVFDDTSS